MAPDPRDAIWNETHHLLYNASYTEELETALLARWTWLDSVTKIAVAISSGSAALTGLVFWKNSDYTFLWPVFTSVSTLLAIVPKELSVAKRLKVHAASVGSLAGLRAKGRHRLADYPDESQRGIPIAEFEEKLLTLRNRYKVESDEFPYDLLLTERLRLKTQKKLNASWHPQSSTPGAHHGPRPARQILTTESAAAAAQMTTPRLQAQAGAL